MDEIGYSVLNEARKTLVSMKICTVSMSILQDISRCILATIHQECAFCIIKKKASVKNWLRNLVATPECDKPK